jgi:hypothetical protein
MHHVRSRALARHAASSLRRAGLALCAVAPFAVAVHHARCDGPAGAGLPPLADASCRVSLRGAIEGDYPCTAVRDERGDRLEVKVATPPGARAQVTLRAALVRGEAGLVAEPQAVTLREPAHGGVGLAWTRPGALGARVDRARAVVVLTGEVGPARANPDGRSVEVTAEVPLPRERALAWAR